MLSHPLLNYLDIHALYLSLCSCFISHIGVFFGLFLVPIFVVIMINLVIFVLVIRVLLKHNRRRAAKVDTSKSKVYKATLKTLISISGVMLLFGLTWLFGALTIGSASPAFQWMFVIFNTLQGFFLFVFFCIIGKDAREEWIHFLTRRKHTTIKISTTASKADIQKSKPSTESSYMTSKEKSLTTPKSTGITQPDDSFVFSQSKIEANLNESQTIFIPEISQVSASNETLF